jgi:DNA polymerase I-like protein with 3'-5' exonuclease and polymerase domains
LDNDVIVEAREDIAGDVAQIVKISMEDAFNKLLPNVPFKVEPEIRDSWGVI